MQGLLPPAGAQVRRNGILAPRDIVAANDARSFCGPVEDCEAIQGTHVQHHFQE
jgi:hypothetical protein